MAASTLPEIKRGIKDAEELTIIISEGETFLVKEMDFTWAVEKVERWDENYIYHNAGVEDKDRDTLFLKADFMNKYPYLETKEYSKEFASYKYYEIIKSIGKKSCLL